MKGERSDLKEIMDLCISTNAMDSDQLIFLCYHWKRKQSMNIDHQFLLVSSPPAKE